MNHDDLVHNLIFVVIVLHIWRIHERAVRSAPSKFPKFMNMNKPFLRSLGWSLPNWKLRTEEVVSAPPVEVAPARRSASALLADPRPPYSPVRAPGVAWTRRHSSNNSDAAAGIDPDGQTHPALDRPEHGAQPAGGAPSHARRGPAGGLMIKRGRGHRRVGDGVVSPRQDRPGQRRESWDRLWRRMHLAFRFGLLLTV